MKLWACGPVQMYNGSLASCNRCYFCKYPQKVVKSQMLNGSLSKAQAVSLQIGLCILRFGLFTEVKYLLGHIVKGGDHLIQR
jgi:hypothetical protein